MSETAKPLHASATFYRMYLEELGVIHWLTLDHIAKPWRKFRAKVAGQEHGEG